MVRPLHRTGEGQTSQDGVGSLKRRSCSGVGCKDLRHTPTALRTTGQAATKLSICWFLLEPWQCLAALQSQQKR